ncbi:MAG: sulfatase-like hydrolase/transferase [Deltaproteobacteria bacterium]|nr:sulfatase-like hydrolase/transferase [Deltaproteobacteria bacterium]MBW2419325.1 sulfatase-like hydrolase/transferase [Deltaproteobacteria bacterium]
MNRPIPKRLLLLLLPATGFLATGIGCEAEQERVAPAAPPTSRAQLAPPEEPRPLNLVLITVDTTRADALGSYGQPLESSPNFDRLARHGVLFEQAISASPSTLPSHSTLFTGKLPYAHGARANAGYILAKENRTLAEVLRDAGYRTEAQVAARVMRESTQVAQGFDSYRGPDSEGVQLKRIIYADETGKQIGDEIERPIRTGADISRYGMSFIRSNRDRPFFLWLHYFDPHHPYYAPPVFNAKLPGEPYLAEVASADAEIGRVIQVLIDLGLKDRTLVIVTSDHGEGHGDHDEDTHSYFVYDSTMHVPLVFWGTRLLRPGLRISSLVRSADVAPTALDLLGLPPLENVQGVSLRPLLTGEQAGLDLAAYGESIEHHRTFGMPPLRMFRKGRWKYIHKVNPELYDVEADPKELVNLASREPERLAEMRSGLRELIEQAPPAPADSTVVLDSETQDQLIALGYVGGGAAAPVAKEIDWFDVSGPDPTAKTDEVGRIARVYGQLRGKRFDLALSETRALLESNPESDVVRSIHLQALVGAGELDLAMEQFRAEVEPASAQSGTYRKLADALTEAGREEEAAEVMTAALLLTPCDESSRLSLYLFFHTRKRYAEEVRMLEGAVRECPDSIWNANTYAWALATLPEDSLRDGEKAVAQANRALSLSDVETDPSHLDTLAAAQAEAGDFEAAAATAEKAVRLASKQKKLSSEQIAGFEQNLAEIRAGRPVRSP